MSGSLVSFMPGSHVVCWWTHYWFFEARVMFICTSEPMSSKAISSKTPTSTANTSLLPLRAGIYYTPVHLAPGPLIRWGLFFFCDADVFGVSCYLILGCCFAFRCWCRSVPAPLMLLLADLATYEKAVQLMTGKYSYLFYSAQE